MAKFTDAVRNTLIGYFNIGDQPTEAQFTAMILAIQEGIEEHQHDGTGDGDGRTDIGPIGVDLVIRESNSMIGLSIEAYDDGANLSRLHLRKSDTDTLGSLVETDAADVLGAVYFQGVNTTPGWGYGAAIYAIQRAASGATYLETDLILQTYSSAAINTNQLVLDGGSGYVGLGLVPTYKFDVIAQVASAVANFFNDGNLDANYGLRTQCGLDANSAANHLAMFDGDGTVIGAVKGDGAGGAQLWSACDRRLKDVQGDLPASDAIAALKAVTPKKYKGKGGKKKAVGFIAQDFIDITEGIVSYDEENDLWGLSYGRLTAYLWAQNKALLERIEQLEAK